MDFRSCVESAVRPSTCAPRRVFDVHVMLYVCESVFLWLKFAASLRNGRTQFDVLIVLGIEVAVGDKLVLTEEISEEHYCSEKKKA